MQEATPAPLLHGISESARLLNLGRTKTYELLDSGALKSIRIGSRRLIPDSEIRRFIAERMEVTK